MQAVCSECQTPNPAGSDACSNCGRPLAAQPQPGLLRSKRNDRKHWLISGAVFAGICLFGLVSTFLLRRTVVASPLGPAQITATQPIALQDQDPTPEPAPALQTAYALEPEALPVAGDSGGIEGSLAEVGLEAGGEAAEPAEPAPAPAGPLLEGDSMAGPASTGPELEVAPYEASQAPEAPEAASGEDAAIGIELGGAALVTAGPQTEASGLELGAAPATACPQTEATGAEPQPLPPLPTPSPIPPPAEAPKPVPTPIPPPPPAKKPAAPPPAVPMGAQARAGNWLLTVTGVQWHETLRWQEWSRDAEGIWAVLLLDIQNQGESASPFRMLDWELRGGQGAVYDESATYYAAWQFSGRETAYTDLAPGQGAQIVMAFDVPKGIKGLMLYTDRLARTVVQIGDGPAASGP